MYVTSFSTISYYSNSEIDLKNNFWQVYTILYINIINFLYLKWSRLAKFLFSKGLNHWKTDRPLPLEF